MIATVIHDICGDNGCDTGETILGLVLIIAICTVIIAMVKD